MFIPIFIYTLCTITIFIIIYIFLFRYEFRYEFFSVKQKDNSIDIVISRYNEPLDWLNTESFTKYTYNPDYKTNIIIYNKGSYLNGTIPLPNVGRCDHTYLYHIINNYDNLADVTIFLPGSADMESKIDRTKFIFKRAYEDMDTSLVCTKVDSDSLYNFSLDEWKSSNEMNAEKNTDSEMLKADPRPFGKWFLFMNNVETEEKQELLFRSIGPKSVCFSALLAISRANIHNRPKSFYEKLIKHVNSHHNPEAGHYIERSWLAIFHPINPDRLYYNI